MSRCRCIGISTCRNIGISKYRNIEMSEYRNIDILKYRNIGTSKCRNIMARVKQGACTGLRRSIPKHFPSVHFMYSAWGSRFALSTFSVRAWGCAIWHTPRRWAWGSFSSILPGGEPLPSLDFDCVTSSSISPMFSGFLVGFSSDFAGGSSQPPPWFGCPM